jgi:hypothetical protein
VYCLGLRLLHLGLLKVDQMEYQFLFTLCLYNSTILLIHFLEFNLCISIVSHEILQRMSNTNLILTPSDFLHSLQKIPISPGAPSSSSGTFNLIFPHQTIFHHNLHNLNVKNKVDLRYSGSQNWKVETKILLLSNPNISNKHLSLFPSNFNGDSLVDFLFL